MRLKDIAQSAGVSVSTVSRVMNGDAGPSDEVVRRVLSVAEEKGYLRENPRQASRIRIRRGIRSGSVALVQLHDGNRSHATLYVELVRGAAQALAEHGLNMITVQADTPEHLPPAILDKQVDGLLMLGPWTNGPVEARLRDIPSVWLTTSNPCGESDAVLAGNERAGQLAATYLLDLGHRRLVCINPAAVSTVYAARCESFLFGAHRAGVQADLIARPGEIPLQHGRLDLDLLERDLGPLVEGLQKQPERPFGLFVPDDAMTAVVYRLLRRHGLQPGVDLDVISFGNEPPYLAALDPRPATIDIGADVIGRRAVEQLLWRLRSPHEERAVEVAIQAQVVPAERVCVQAR